MKRSPPPLLPLPVEHQLHAVVLWARYFARMPRRQRGTQWTRVIRAHRRMLLAAGLDEDVAELEVGKFYSAMKLEGFRRRCDAPALAHHHG